MKGALFTLAGLGVGGAAWFGMDGPDFDRVVDRRPIEVYAAFSARPRRHGSPSRARDAVDKQRSLRVGEQRGESLSYEILFDDRPVVTAELSFAAAGEDGRQTRMTAELEIDEYELGSAFETEAGVALSMIPESLDRHAVRQFHGRHGARRRSGPAAAAAEPQQRRRPQAQSRGECRRAPGQRRACPPGGEPAVSPAPGRWSTPIASPSAIATDAPPKDAEPGGWGR